MSCSLCVCGRPGTGNKQHDLFANSGGGGGGDGPRDDLAEAGRCKERRPIGAQSNELRAALAGRPTSRPDWAWPLWSPNLAGLASHSVQFGPVNWTFSRLGLRLPLAPLACLPAACRFFPPSGGGDHDNDDHHHHNHDNRIGPSMWSLPWKKKFSRAHRQHAGHDWPPLLFIQIKNLNKTTRPPVQIQSLRSAGS